MRALAPCDEAWACRPPPRSPPPAGVSHVAGLLCGFVACEGPGRSLADPAISVQRHAPRLGGDRHLGLGGQLRRQSAGVPWALRTSTVGGARSIPHRSSACHAGVTVGTHPGAGRGGRAALPPCRKRLRTRSTVSRLRQTRAALSATERPWWARRTLWERRRSLGLVVVSSNCRSSVTWVSGKGGRVREVAVVPFRKEEHHHTPLYYTANIFWKHLGQ